MTTTTLSIDEIFSHAWYLLRRNPVVVVPGFVIGLVVGFVGGVFFAPPPLTATPPAGAITMRFIYVLADLAIAMFAYIATTAFTTGMAGAAWERGKATLGDGLRAFERDWAHVFTAALYMLALEYVAALIAIPTLFLSFLAVTMLTFYVLPSAIIGEQRGWDAIRESFRISTRRYLTTIAVVVFLIVAGLAAAKLAQVLRLAGPAVAILATVVQQALIGFSSLVAVGEYLNFRELVTTPVRR